MSLFELPVNLLALIRTGLGLLFVLNTIALVAFSTAHSIGLSKPKAAAIVLSAVNILANALLFYALERM